MCETFIIFINTLQENWIPGYGIAYGMFGEMLFYCYFGTKVTISVSSWTFFYIEANTIQYDGLERTAGLHHDTIQLVHLRLTFTEDILEFVKLMHECRWIVDRTCSTIVGYLWDWGIRFSVSDWFPISIFDWSADYQKHLFVLHVPNGSCVVNAHERLNGWVSCCRM